MKKELLRLLVKAGVISRKSMLKEGMRRMGIKALQRAEDVGTVAGALPGYALVAPIAGGIAVGHGMAKGFAAPFKMLAAASRQHAAKKEALRLRSLFGR